MSYCKQCNQTIADRPCITDGEVATCNIMRVSGVPMPEPVAQQLICKDSMGNTLAVCSYRTRAEAMESMCRVNAHTSTINPLYTADQLRDYSEALASALQWRNLALQFDDHRMQALWHLKMLIADSGHAEAAQAFVDSPPLSGEEVLAQRMAVLTKAVL